MSFGLAIVDESEEIFYYNTSWTGKSRPSLMEILQQELKSVQLSVISSIKIGPEKIRDRVNF